MKSTFFWLALMSSITAGPLAAAAELPWKQPMFETEIRSNYMLFPSIQTVLRYGTPTELDAAHSLKLFLGPKIGSDEDPFWVMPHVGTGVKLDRGRHDFLTLVGIWAKFSLFDRTVSYQIFGDLAVTLPWVKDGTDLEVRHWLDLNVVIPVEPRQDDLARHWHDDVGRRWHQDRDEKDPWKRDHWLLQFGVHAQNRNVNFDVGPAVTAKYHWLRVGFEYLVGFQKANRGQTFRVNVASDFDI